MPPVRWILSLLLCSSLAAQTEVRIATGITPSLNIFQRIQAAFEKSSGLKLVLVDARSPAAWDLLDKGQVEAAAAGLTWEEWVRSMKDQGLRLPEEGETRRIQIGSDKIQVLMHLDIMTLQLEKAELAGIFTGKIQNWKELNIADAPIKVVIDPNQDATNDLFRSRMLDGAAFRSDALLVPPGHSLLQTIETTPLAVGFGPMATIRSLKINSPITPNVPRPILLLIKGPKPTPGIKKLLDFLDSRAARALVVN